MRPSAATLRWVERAVGSGARVTWVRPVRLGSTAVHEVRLRGRSGRTLRFALRRFVDASRLGSDPWYVPENELHVLRALEGSDVRAPQVVAEDVGASRGCDVPTLLATWVPGRAPAFDPGADLGRAFVQMADQLAEIHEVPLRTTARLPAYRPYHVGDGSVRLPTWSPRLAMWERALAAVGRTARPTPAGFIHRDYHPANTLWLRGRLSGVVDWTTGCVGPFGVDLARMRLNLAAEVGPSDAERFLSAYERGTGRLGERDPYWDLVDALDFVTDAVRPRTAPDRQRSDRFERWVERCLWAL
jgi:aminoglycoside phosphotransferase (APT) family kinase protein